MTAHSNSVVLIVPAAERDRANRLSCALGYDDLPAPGDSFSVPLAASGSVATHYGMHAWATDVFVLLLVYSQSGELPPAPLDQFGLAPADAAAAIGAMTVSVNDNLEDPLGHWRSALAAAGLSQIDPPPPALAAR